MLYSTTHFNVVTSLLVLMLCFSCANTDQESNNRKIEVLDNLSKSAQEKSDYTQAKETNTIDAFRAYLTKYPSGAYSENAKKNIASLEEVIQHDEYWKEIKMQNTIAAYNQYIDEHPDGKYSILADEQIEKLTEEQDWQRALRMGSIIGYETYRSEYPNGSYIASANQKIEEINAKRRHLKNDHAAFEKAKKGNSIKSYEKYLSDYPAGYHHKKARNLIRAKTANSRRSVRITMIDLTCEKSDDEGSWNDADMDEFRFTLDSKQENCSPTSKTKSITSKSTIYEYTGPEIEVKKGQVWKDKNKSIDIEFDNEHCSILNLTINGYAREQDNGTASKDETSSSLRTSKDKPLTIKIAKFGEGEKKLGTLTGYLKTKDFEYKCRFRIDAI